MKGYLILLLYVLLPGLSLQAVDKTKKGKSPIVVLTFGDAVIIPLRNILQSICNIWHDHHFKVIALRDLKKYIGKR